MPIHIYFPYVIRILVLRVEIRFYVFNRVIKVVRIMVNLAFIIISIMAVLY